MFLLIIYTLLSLIIGGIFYQSMDYYYSTKDLPYNSDYPKTENVIVYLIFTLFWPIVSIIRFYQFFKHNSLTRFVITVNLLNWEIFGNLSKYTIDKFDLSKSKETKTVYNFLCFTFTYQYKKI